MKKVYLPVLFGKECLATTPNGVKLFTNEMDGFYSLDDAEAKARQLALTDPKAKVVIFVSELVVEPRKIEFATKKFNDSGELVA